MPCQHPRGELSATEPHEAECRHRPRGEGAEVVLVQSQHNKAGWTATPNQDGHVSSIKVLGQDSPRNSGTSAQESFRETGSAESPAVKAQIRTAMCRGMTRLLPFSNSAPRSRRGLREHVARLRCAGPHFRHRRAGAGASLRFLGHRRQPLADPRGVPRYPAGNWP
jgi:hypothetical protein